MVEQEWDSFEKGREKMKNNVYELRKNVMADSIRHLTAFAFIAVVPLILAACSSDNVAGGASGDAGVYAVKDLDVAGVSQKGPFLTGSSVTVQELDGRTLVQTGKSFRASVKNNLGDFVVKGVTLASQYALLEVNGYYRNEISGERSKGVIALNALTDLSDRNHVNVNMLTHLTTDRILALVQKEGMSFAEAKKQAEREVMTSFGVLDDLGNGEDLNLFAGDGGAMLLAMSVLMQGDGSEADLSERIAHATIAFGGSGVWQDPAKAEIADWAFQVDEQLKKTKAAGDMLQDIRKKVEAWNIADSVPHFEEFVYKFWAREYGLGLCNDSNVYEVKDNVNELSQYYRDEFMCNSNGRWSLIRMRDFPNDNYEELYVKGPDGGNRYKVISIGGTKWMAENLRERVDYVGRGTSACYNEEQSKCDSYGELYDRAATRVACPEGYMTPSVADVKALLLFYGGEGKIAAQALRSAEGFGAVYGGMVDSKGQFLGLHESAVFWTTSYDSLLRIDSLGARLEYAKSQILRASIRCVKK